VPRKRRPIDWGLAKSVAAEVAETEAQPSRAQVASRMGLIESTFNNRARSEGMEAELDAILDGGSPPTTGIISAANDPTPAPWKAEDVIRAHGDDPENVVILRQRGNRWGTPEGPNHQLRVDWIRKDDTLQAADEGEWYPPPKPRKRKADEPRQIMVIADHHAPYHEPTFHKLTLEWLAEHQPDEIDVNGDLGDYETLSRFRNKKAAKGANLCIQGSYNILRDYRHICPDAKITLKRGNHDERLHYFTTDNAEELGVVTAAGEDTPQLDFRRLLKLDSLRVDYIDEEWDQASNRLSRELTTWHGYSAAKSAPQQMLQGLGGSNHQNHTHRLSMVLHTRHDPELKVRMAVEGGCACIIPGGLNYIPGGQPNWQNAFAIYDVWDDGIFAFSPAIYIGGELVTPGRRYTA